MSKVKTGKLVTKDIWIGYTKSMSDTGFLDYLDANKDFVDVLDKMLKKADSFKALKSELTDLIQERKDFIKFASTNLP